VIISLNSLSVRVITDYALAAFRAANSEAGKLCGITAFRKSAALGGAHKTKPHRSGVLLGALRIPQQTRETILCAFLMGLFDLAQTKVLLARVHAGCLLRWISSVLLFLSSR
jgi:hypothetical protein